MVKCFSTPVGQGLLVLFDRTSRGTSWRSPMSSAIHLAEKAFLWDHMTSPLTESRQTGCVVHWPLEKQSCYKICFWEVLIHFPLCQCWRSWDTNRASLRHSFWPYSLVSVTAAQAMNKAWRCVQARTPVHNCTQSLLIENWDGLCTNEAIRKPGRASACACCELVSKLPLWVPSNVIFYFYQLENTSETSLPLVPCLWSSMLCSAYIQDIILKLSVFPTFFNERNCQISTVGTW